VNRNIAPDFPYFVHLSSLDAGSSRSERSTGEAAPVLPVGAALMAIFLLSLGLWGAIWVTASSLTLP
jgi:hypothetical protein